MAVSDQRSKDIVDGLGEAAPGEADRHASQVIVDALRAHRGAVGGQAAVPADDPQLSSKIMAEARTRSQQIKGGAGSSASTSTKRIDKPIPAWLWLAWIAAIAGFIALWFLLK